MLAPVSNRIGYHRSAQMRILHTAGTSKSKQCILNNIKISFTLASISSQYVTISKIICLE